MFFPQSNLLFLSDIKENGQIIINIHEPDVPESAAKKAPPLFSPPPRIDAGKGTGEGGQGFLEFYAEFLEN